MKKLLISFLSLSFILSSACHSKLYTRQSINRQIADDRGNKNLIGLCNKKALEKKPYSVWFNKNYANYQIDTVTAEKLKPGLAGKQITLFMGTWCGDSRREIPRIFKILDYCGVSENRIKLVMLSREDSTYKQSPTHEEKGLNIHRVPDLIVYDNGQEMGRIVESPIISLEKDLLSILSKEPYSPNYRGVSFLVDLFRNKSISEIRPEDSGYVNKLHTLVKNSSELNTYGYVLMAAKEMEKAGLVFRFNTVLFPGDANVFDSMGEYYLRTGNKNDAKQNYLKTLQLEPSNEDAKQKLAEIGIGEKAGKY